MTFKNNNEYIKRGSETSAAKTSKAYLRVHVTGYSFRRGRGGGVALPVVGFSRRLRPKGGAFLYFSSQCTEG